MVRTKLNRLTAMLLSFIMILSSFSALTAVETKAATDKITLEPESVKLSKVQSGALAPKKHQPRRCFC